MNEVIQTAIASVLDPSVLVTILLAGTNGQPATVAWSQCRLAPLPGQASNPDCVSNPTASYIEPIGEGATVTATMPAG